MQTKYFYPVPSWLILMVIGLMTTSLSAQMNPPMPTLDPVAHPKFVNPLPVPNVIDMTAGGNLNIKVKKSTQWLGLVTPNGTNLNTQIFGYGLNIATYPGPTILTMQGNPINVTWDNKLPNSHLLPIDMSLHMANWKANKGIPIVTHLHGGHVEAASDGYPEAWYTRNWGQKGPWWEKQVYTYANDQQAGTLWYHDHTLGITRLNVYAGMAGFYLLTDQNEQDLITNNVLPDMGYGLAIQDRMFLPNGALIMPFQGEIDLEDCPNGPNPPPLPFPSIVAEFFGDFILVNGMAWPYQDVEPRKYRYRLLNGSDSRFYEFQLSNGMNIMVIGNDDGLLHQPVNVSNLVMGPGERYDVILDFEGHTGEFITLQNTGPDAPYTGANGGVDPNRPTGQIMQFKVVLPLTQATATVGVNTVLNDPPSLPIPTVTRKFVLFEGRDEYCRLRPALGNYLPGTPNDPLNGSLMWDQPVNYENPDLGATEAWEIYNTTMDAHPMHLHLVSFLIDGRASHNGIAEVIGRDHHGGSKSVMHGPGGANDPVTVGAWAAPAAYESGWKDEIIIGPGSVGRVIATFDKPGRYVWHCHILSHEDHEMMRPFHVGPIPGQGGNMPELVQTDEKAELEQNAPNPFSGETNIIFTLPQTQDIQLDVFDMNGRWVGNLARGKFQMGHHNMIWNGKDAGGQPMPNGIYICRLVTGDQILTKRMSLVR